MKILALYGGPRKAPLSKTETMLNAFVDGCRDQGAEVKIIKLKDMDIKDCLGCLSCWWKTPGSCVQKDDMAQIVDDINQSDVEIWATPLYFWGPSALLKRWLDRCIIMTDPHICIGRDGLTTHPRGKQRDRVIISAAGLYEADHFKWLSEWAHGLALKAMGPVKLELYRPMAEFLHLHPLRKQWQEILDATRQAGREFVNYGKVGQEVIDIVQQELLDTELFIKQTNEYIDWQREIAQRKARIKSKASSAE
ncbi:MAG: flavodoxin family protein [Candidatus Saccharibacteria bacterium]